jgi:nitroreductase
MDALLAIHTRQSTGVVRPDAIPKDIIEKLLSAGVQAPNHYKVRPWRFFVITGEGLTRLGDVMSQSLAQRVENLPAEALEKERSKPLRAPLIIAVGVDKPTETKVLEIENICATAAACQNILLAAHALGLAAIWRTGPAAIDPLIKKFLGLPPDQHIISFLYIGFPEKQQSIPERPDFSDRTTWIGASE